MKILQLIAILSLLWNITLADDEFGEEEITSSRNVILRESGATKSFSIFTIGLFFKFDRYILRPLAVSYTFFTTENFRLSVKDASETRSQIFNLHNNLLVFSPQRILASAGYLLTNLTLGRFGTFDVAKKLKMNSYKTKTSDVLRFYHVPEVYFITLGPMPFTLTTTMEFGMDNIISGYDEFSPNFSSFYVGFLNGRALEMKTFDIFQKIKPEMIYENLKTATYSEAKYFNLERKPFKEKFKRLEKWSSSNFTTN